jgi:hypothetical protein
MVGGEVIVLPTERPVGHHLPPLRVSTIQLLTADHRCLLIVVDMQPASHHFGWLKWGPLLLRGEGTVVLPTAGH